MAKTTVFREAQAVKFLCNIFDKIIPDRVFRVRITGKQGEQDISNFKTKIKIAGFSQKSRKELGMMEDLNERTGSVYLYGDEQPDYCIVLEKDGEPEVFLLDDVYVKKEGLGESLLNISSKSWKKASSIDIFLKNIYSDDDAFNFFNRTLCKKINAGTYTARLGKWVSKKAFDSDIKKEERDMMCLYYAFKQPEKELISTMIIGSDIKVIKFTPGDLLKNIEHTIKAEHKLDSTTVKFRGMVIESRVPGKEIGSRGTTSSYVYITGTPFNATTNLIIIRHHLKNL